jgi:hypothetical protein
MALLRNLSPELQAQRQAMVDDCAAHIDVSTDLKVSEDPYFIYRARLDEFDDNHDLDGIAEGYFERLERAGFAKTEEDGEWTVIEIHALILDALDDDLDLEDVDLFKDLLQLFN